MEVVVFEFYNKSDLMNTFDYFRIDLNEGVIKLITANSEKDIILDKAQLKRIISNIIGIIMDWENTYVSNKLDANIIKMNVETTDGTASNYLFKGAFPKNFHVLTEYLNSIKEENNGRV